MIFTNKFQPKEFSDFDADFSYLDEINDIPHTIIYGEEGIGKFSLAQVWLKNNYGQSIFNIKKIVKEYKASNKVIDLGIYYTNYHYVINPCLYGLYDKNVLQQFIKDISSTSNISKSLSNEKSYKIIVIQNAEQLTPNAQNALRSTMEKHIKNCRLIFLSKSLNKIIEPILSRCLKIKFESPKRNFVENLLLRINETENLNVSEQNIKNIVKFSGTNVRKAINSIELCSLYLRPQKNYFTIENNINKEKDSDEDSDKNLNKESNDKANDKININNENLEDLFMLDDTENILNIIISNIFNLKNFSNWYNIRNDIYNLLISCQKPNKIFKLLFNIISKRLENIYKKSLSKEKKENINESYKIILSSLLEYQQKCNQGNKPVIYIELFLMVVTRQVFKIKSVE